MNAESILLRPETDELAVDQHGQTLLVRWAMPSGILVGAEIMGPPYTILGPTSYGVPLYSVEPPLPVTFPLPIHMNDREVLLHGPIAMQKK